MKHFAHLKHIELEVVIVKEEFAEDNSTSPLQHCSPVEWQDQVCAAGERRDLVEELVRICGLTHAEEQPAGIGGAQSLCQEEPQAYAITGMSHQLENSTAGLLPG